MRLARFVLLALSFAAGALFAQNVSVETAEDEPMATHTSAVTQHAAAVAD